MFKDFKENMNRMRRSRISPEVKKYNILNEYFTFWDLYKIKHCRRKYQSTSTNRNRTIHIKANKTRKMVRASDLVTIPNHVNSCITGVSEE